MQGEIDSLRSAIDRMGGSKTPALVTPASEVEVIDMPRTLVKYTPQADTMLIDHTPSIPSVKEATAKTLEETERETLRRSLENNDGRRKATAKELNISERTLYRKIKEYGLE